MERPRTKGLKGCKVRKDDPEVNKLHLTTKFMRSQKNWFPTLAASSWMARVTNIYNLRGIGAAIVTNDMATAWLNIVTRFHMCLMDLYNGIYAPHGAKVTQR